jgi:hypothetical protein
MLMNRYLELLINTPPRFYLHTAKYKLAEKSKPEDYNQIKPCAFVLSTGRAGTETLARLLELDKKIIALHEPLPKLFGLSKTCYDLSKDFTADETVSTALVEGFLTGRRDLLNYALYNGKGYVETGPHVTFAAPWILKAIPDAHIIHQVRSPKGVAASGVRRKWYAGQINDQWRITPKPSTPFHAAWAEMSQVEKLLWLWAETNQWIMDFGSGLNQDQFLTVRSEDLFAGEEPTIRTLYSFIGLETPRQARVKAVLRKQINAQRSGTFDRPADWADAVRPELAEFVANVAAALGYTFP